jgi:hypothetical protein
MEMHSRSAHTVGANTAEGPKFLSVPCFRSMPLWLLRFGAWGGGTFPVFLDIALQPSMNRVHGEIFGDLKKRSSASLDPRALCNSSR